MERFLVRRELGINAQYPGEGCFAPGVRVLRLIFITDLIMEVKFNFQLFPAELLWKEPGPVMPER